MSILRRIRPRNVLLLMLLAVLIGCGGATNNDQGTSFLALGFFADGDADEGDAGTVVYLNEDVPGAQGSIPGALFVPIGDKGFVGLRNNLTSQFIRTTGIDCCYTIPGSDPSLVIPCDAWGFTAIVEPNGGEVFSQVEQVSPDVLQFISVSINSLPELPFRMLAECTVTGVSQAGDVLETNPINYQIQFAERPECCTGSDAQSGAAFQEGLGVGGNIAAFGDADDESLAVTESAFGGGSSGDELIDDSDVGFDDSGAFLREADLY